MEEFREYCAQQVIQLEKIIKTSRRFLRKAPEGSLRISKSNESIQYYWRSSSTDKSGKYIRRSDEELARLLAKKEYATRVIPVARKNMQQLQQLQEIDNFQELDQVYESLPVGMQQLVTPFVVPQDVYEKEWKKRCSKKAKGAKHKIETGFTTENGELVRSKSEKIIADKLFMMGIPYVYEMALRLNGYGTVHPDFTVLNKRTRKEYYWEHLGMMDKLEYTENAMKKIEAYENNGYYQGASLITTYETKQCSPDMKVLENKIKFFLT